MRGITFLVKMIKNIGNDWQLKKKKMLAGKGLILHNCLI